MVDARDRGDLPGRAPPGRRQWVRSEVAAFLALFLGSLTIGMFAAAHAVGPAPLVLGHYTVSFFVAVSGFLVLLVGLVLFGVDRLKGLAPHAGLVALACASTCGSCGVQSCTNSGIVVSTLSDTTVARGDLWILSEAAAMDGDSSHSLHRCVLVVGPCLEVWHGFASHVESSLEVGPSSVRVMGRRWEREPPYSIHEVVVDD